MKKIGFIGVFDKIDLLIYIAKILTKIEKKVLVIDSTSTQKARYIVPVLKPEKSYVTEFEDIDIAVGFKNIEEIEKYLDLENGKKIETIYDFVLIDIDNAKSLEIYDIQTSERNYFVTSFDLYSMKKSLEILEEIPNVTTLTKVLYSKKALIEENRYLEHLALGYKIQWDEEQVFFPFELGDASVIAENQRVSKIKFKKFSSQYKEALIFVSEQLVEECSYSELKKLFKQLERGV